MELVREAAAHFVELKYVINGVDTIAPRGSRRMLLSALCMPFFHDCRHDCCVSTRMRRKVGCSG